MGVSTSLDTSGNLGASQPPLAAIPAHRFGERLVGVQLGAPQLGWGAFALGRDPVGMRDIARAVGGQLGAATAEERVEPPAGLEQQRRGRKRPKRSEEGRGGKEGVSTCRFRWPQYPKNKQVSDD